MDGDRDVDSKNVIAQLVDCFNGAPVVAQWRDEGLKVNSALLGWDRRSNSMVKEPITALIAACRSRFPGIQFRCERVDRSDDGLIGQWIGRWQQNGQAEVVSVPCSCRVRLAGQSVRELWLTVDEYSVLDQLGRLCANPGQASGGSDRINQSAFESLTAAFVSGKPVSGDFFAPQVEMHVSVELYRDLARGVQVDTFRLESVGTIDQLVALARKRFGAPIELSFKKGISQGRTTTFRGTIRARIGAQAQRYLIVCGFVAARNSVSECWLKVTPPPTLLECVA